MLERHGAPFALALPAFHYGAEPGSPWYVAPARAIGFMVVGFFPWSAVLPAAALYRWTGEGGADFAANRETDLLIVTLLLTLVPILFAPAAPLPAVLPAPPPPPPDRRCSSGCSPARPGGSRDRTGFMAAGRATSPP
jgi:hypothetical protein